MHFASQPSQRPKRQLELKFEETREGRVKRLLGESPKLKTAAKIFNEQTYREASAIAKASCPPELGSLVAPAVRTS